jgi:prepilin peptidase CpaA
MLASICMSDLRSRRIPNRLVLFGLLAALAWQALGPAGAGLFHPGVPGALGATSAFAGAAAAFAVFLVLHLMRTMGAGDVKLMAMLGAFFGIEALPALVLSVFLTGGGLVTLRLFDGARRRAVFANLQLILFGRLAALSGSGVGPRFDPRTDSADRLPYALAISGGALLLAALQLTGVIA